MDDQLRDQFDKAMEMVELPPVPGGARLERITDAVTDINPSDGNFLKEAIGTRDKVMQRLIEDSTATRRMLLGMKAALDRQKEFYDRLEEQHSAEHENLLLLKKKSEDLEEQIQKFQKGFEATAGEKDIDETWSEWTKRHAEMDAKFGYQSASGENELGKSEQADSTSSVEPEEKKLTTASKTPQVQPLFHFDDRRMCLFDAKEKKLTKLPLSLPHKARRPGSAFLNGEVYFLGGGGSGGGDFLKSVYKLNKKMEWERLSDMNETRYGIASSCVVFDGRIWVNGGCNNRSGTLKTVEAYDPTSNGWVKKPNMHVSRKGAAAAVLRGKIFVCGGIGTGQNKQDSVEYFDPRLDKWTFCAPLPAVGYGMAAVAQDSLLTLLGGCGYRGWGTDDVWRINVDETEPKWSVMPSMKEWRKHCCASMVDGKIVVAGGHYYKNRPSAAVEVFDEKEWINGPSMEGVDDDITTTLVSLEFAQALLAYNPHEAAAKPATGNADLGASTTSTKPQ